MFSSTNTSVKLHLILIVCVAGVAYFMYQLYNECKDLERELLISKKQIAFLTSNNPESHSCTHQEIEEIVVDIDEDTAAKAEKADKADKADKAEKQDKADKQKVVIDDIDQDTEETEMIDDDDEGVEEDDEEDDEDSHSVFEFVGNDVTSDDEDEEEEATEADVAVEEQEKVVVVEKTIQQFSKKEKETDFSKMSKNSLIKVKISDLKKYLVDRNKNSAGTKSELIDRIIAL
jgi:hypothetical protein